LTVVVDASTVLAVCKQEPGAATVRQTIRGGLISAVNYSEVLYKAASLSKRPIAEAIVRTAEIKIIEFDQKQAGVAADLFAKCVGKGVSFADRACLALALLENRSVVSADRRWSELGLPIEVVNFRLDCRTWS
jgi:ribonuclease VapC